MNYYRSCYKSISLQVKVFWVVTLSNVMVGYWHFRGPCFLHLQGEVVGMGKNDVNIALDWRGVAGATRK
jgi:hypothetical protein